jgi:hypothetical protein
MIDFAQIKTMAKEIGCPVTELLALARQNDPFYVGTPSDIEHAEWFAAQWRATGFTRAHLRRIHYWCVSRSPMLPNGKPYENTEWCWNFLTVASKKARYLGLIPISNIADHKNPDPHIFACYSEIAPGFYVEPPELNDPYIQIQGAYHGADLQPYHLEVWFEKSTMNDVLIPVCRNYSANLVTGEGEMSITAVHDLIGRLKDADKPARIFYGSDFDPAGQSMPRATARKLEWMIRESGFSHEVKLHPLVLTADQVGHYNLPRTPIKESERRAASFEELHGKGAVELDALEALHPGVLKGIVTDALSTYFDQEAATQALALQAEFERAVREKVDEVTARYTPEIEALEAMRDELAEIEIEEFDRFIPKRSTMTVEGEPDWLFDSRREYLEQINYYRGKSV